MANVKITDLTALSGALVDADLFEMVDDVAGTPASRKVTAAVVRDFTNMAQATGTDADTTMAVNTLYTVDMSAWATADRTYTLPATAAVGDRVGIAITAGDASHELVITAGTGDTLNGIAGGTEWSRLFMTSEVVIMRCIVANTTWLVEVDGRKFESCRIDTDGTTASHTRNSSTKISSELATVTLDPYLLWSTANKRFVPRRLGRYVIHGHLQMASMTTGNTCVALMFKNGATVGNGGSSPAVTSSALFPEADVILFYDVTTLGDYFELFVYYSDGATNRSTNTANIYFEVTRLGDDK